MAIGESTIPHVQKVQNMYGKGGKGVLKLTFFKKKNQPKVVVAKNRVLVSLVYTFCAKFPHGPVKYCVFK